MKAIGGKEQEVDKDIVWWRPKAVREEESETEEVQHPGKFWRWDEDGKEFEEVRKNPLKCKSRKMIKQPGGPRTQEPRVKDSGQTRNTHKNRTYKEPT